MKKNIVNTLLAVIVSPFVIGVVWLMINYLHPIISTLVFIALGVFIGLMLWSESKKKVLRRSGVAVVTPPPAPTPATAGPTPTPTPVSPTSKVSGLKMLINQLLKKVWFITRRVLGTVLPWVIVTIIAWLIVTVMEKHNVEIPTTLAKVNSEETAQKLKTLKNMTLSNFGTDSLIGSAIIIFCVALTLWAWQKINN